MVEQGSQVYSSIFKRVWRSHKEEFKKLHRLNAMFLPIKSKFGEGHEILQEDYRSNPELVVPVADPRIASQASKVAQAQIVWQHAHSVPGYDVALVEKKFLQAARVDGIDQIYPGADKVPPLPNPKAQVEQMKMEGVKAKLDHEKWKTIIGLRASQRKTMAEIAKLEAEAIAVMAGVQNDQAALRIQAFDTAINALKTHNDMMNERIEAMSGGKDGQGSGDGGAVPGLADASGNAGVPAVSAPMGGGA
jgi:hypothetical protein